MIALTVRAQKGTNIPVKELHVDPAQRAGKLGRRMKTSCGLLMFVRGAGGLAVLLVHPGGPYWRAKDEGAWSIPKGEPEQGEGLLAAAQREFREETGLQPRGPYMALTPLRQRSGKMVYCWDFEGEPDLSGFRSNTFQLEWPPRSGRIVDFPEADRAALFAPAQALMHIRSGQRGFITELQARLSPAS